MRRIGFTFTTSLSVAAGQEGGGREDFVSNVGKNVFRSDNAPSMLESRMMHGCYVSFAGRVCVPLLHVPCCMCGTNS